MYLSWCFRSWPPEEPLPSRTRRAHVAIAARSMVRPASMTVSTALTMAANPHSAATTRMSSSHTRTDARKPSADGIGTIGSRPAKADRVLHAALPVAGIRVAEPGPEPVARAEQGEQTGPGGRAVGVAVAHADGVVEHHDPGRHARPLEHLRQTPAHAFRGLARQRRHPAHVRTRERHRRETHDPLHASDHGPGSAEIDLRASRRPLRFGEAVRPRSMPPPPTPDPALHRRVRAREPAFPHKPLVPAGRGTAPLDRHAQAGGRPSVHDGRVPVINQRSARASAVRRFG